MIEINKKFMYCSQEYKITHLVESKNRVIVEPVGKIVFPINLNDRIIIDDIHYKIIFINSNKKKINRITLELIK